MIGVRSCPLPRCCFYFDTTAGTGPADYKTTARSEESDSVEEEELGEDEGEAKGENLV